MLIEKHHSKRTDRQKCYRCYLNKDIEKDFLPEELEKDRPTCKKCQIIKRRLEKTCNICGEQFTAKYHATMKCANCR